MIDTADFKEAHPELITRSKNGDHEAFRAIYEKYVKSMYNISIRMLNDKSEAEDVIQESFLAAFRNMKQFKGKSSFGSWLKRIVINHSIDVIKQRKTNIVPLDDTDFAEEVTGEDDEMIYDAETINAAVQKLPDGFRIIVTLFLFEDYSHKKIAEKLNISEGTSKSQYSRGRKKLAEFIQQMNNDHA